LRKLDDILEKNIPKKTLLNAQMQEVFFILIINNKEYEVKTSQKKALN